MKLLLLLLVPTLLACDRQPQRNVSPRPSASEAVLARDNRQSQPPKVIPMPRVQAELDRLILAGFTPHDDHLHPPGVKSCPMADEGGAVM